MSHNRFNQKRMTIKRALLLDEETLVAARELAHRYACSTSEAIRRAVLHHRDAVFGVPPAWREERVHVLDRLFDLFDGHNPEDEIRRLKGEDEYL